MKHLCTILATVFAAAFTASAKTFDWPIDSPVAKAAQFTAYHGETVRFNLRLGGAMTNLSPVAIYYQTNGMGKAEWFGPVPGTVFHPTNDCGAAAYRFFILCNDPDGKDYTANGSLRLLDSPGFEPSAVQLPVQSLDFAAIEVLNPPWPDAATVTNIVLDVAPAPGNYAAVSNAAMTALSRAEAEAGFTEWEYAGLPSDATRISLLLTDNFWQLTFESGGSGYLGLDFSHSSSNDTSLLFICDSELGYPPLQVTAARTRLPTMTDVVNATNGIPRVAESESNPGYAANADWADNANFAITANIAIDAENAISAEQAKSLHGEQDRPADAIFAQLDAATETNAQQTAALASQASQLSQQSQSLSTLGSQVSAIGAHLNAEDAHFVSTNYDSVVHVPEAYVEIKMSNSWITIWREMTRWDRFVGSAFDWTAWNGFHAFQTNVTTELAFKADRAWGVYDSETGGYSPEGYTQISSSNILIAAGMAYQRTVTSSGSVWVLQCNSGAATIGGDTNGFFRVIDGDGNTQFEIVKGDRREMGADASGITVSAGNVMTIPYSVESAEHPTISCCNNLATANWKDETDADCLCSVSWSGTSGAWVTTVTPKTAQPSMFVKATFMAGGETYIRNLAPVSMDAIVIRGVKYYLGTAVISGHTVLTLSTTPPSP